MLILIDVLIIIVIIIYILDGYRQGFLKQLVDLGGIVLSFIIAIKYYEYAAIYLNEQGIAATLSRSLGFFSLWAISQVFFYLLIVLLFRYVPDFLNVNKINKFLGTLPGLIKGLIIISLFLILLMTLPLKPATKQKFSSTLIAGNLIKSSAEIETQIDAVLGTMNSGLSFIGRVSQNGEKETLGFQTTDINNDEGSEIEILVLINEERAKAGLTPLKQDILLRNIARAHARDMLIKGYFSHTDLEGKSPTERLKEVNVQFNINGENLALAPTADLAHVGLMNSVNHRENILSAEFKKVGIGVIDAGDFGKMVVEEFTD